MNNIYILGIETSCDETAAAITQNGRKICSNVVASQIKDHAPFGGVVPEIASRKHIESIIPVIDQAIKAAGIHREELDGIAVTYGPGLAGALLVGIATAKSLSYVWDKPLIGVNHIAGHIAANYIDHPDLEPPFLCLVASGGHSHIIQVKEYDRFRVLGQTRDDAAGEAFDKVARVLGLSYPGGAAIDGYAQTGNSKAYPFPITRFPDDSQDFSFSGIKTAVMNTVNKLKLKGEEINISDIAASFQDAVTKILVENTIKAAIREKANTVCIAGGVGANSMLRARMEEAGANAGIRVRLPSIKLCGDNGAMIACAGYYKYIRDHFADMTLDAKTRDTSIYEGY